jgi:2-methylisocitrate lyase-like PEP mutase family enzyme
VARVSAGHRFRQALAAERPLQVVGTINAYHARLAQASGYRAIYLSDRVKAVVDARTDAEFLVIARTDALAARLPLVG